MADTTHDLTNKVRALEKELHNALKREADKDNLLRNSPDIIYRTDLKGYVTYISHAVTRLCGYTVKEATGMHMADEVYLYPEARKDFLEQLQKHGRVDNFINPLKHKNGSVWWGAANAHLFTNDDGEVAGVEGVVRDVTKQIEITQALKESEKKYRLLYESAGLGIGYWKKDGVLISFNRLAAENLNGKPKDFAGKTTQKIYGKKSGKMIIDRIRQSAATSKELNFEDIISGKTFLSTYNRIQNSAGDILGIQIISTDITHRKKAEKEREKLIRELTDTLSEVTELRGLIPICASCKKIRDDEGYWNQIESYIEARSKAVFSHGTCPACMKKKYGNKKWYKKNVQKVNIPLEKQTDKKN